jgi:penicillin-insensitive murein endopeptidase
VRAAAQSLALAGLVVGLAVGSAGCPRLGVIDDGTSVSWGPANNGKLMRPIKVPRRGEGYHVPPRWWTRGNNWGTDEMVDLIAYMGRRVRSEHRGSSIGIADLSPRRGGPSRWHRSHQSGRDVDLIFFVTDGKGRPVAYDDMRHINDDGVTRAGTGADGSPLPSYKFDVERNWTLIKAALTNPIARVQYIFVSDPLRQMMLEHARQIGESPDLIAAASYVVKQPGGAAPHDDHFHVRIYCSRSDRDAGCEDYGPLRWTKRDQKYVEGSRRSLVAGLPQSEKLARVPAMLSLGTLPFRGFVPKK